MKYCNRPITLKDVEELDTYKHEYDVVLCINDANLDANFDLSKVKTKTKVLNEARNPRVIVFIADSAKNYFELCSYVGTEVPTLDKCTMLFEPPDDDLQPAEVVDSRTFTNNMDNIGQYEMLKFGDRFYERKQTRMQRIASVRDRIQVNDEDKLSTFDFRSMTVIQNVVGPTGMGWFATWFDQIVAQDRAQMGVWLLQQCDAEELNMYESSLDEINKRRKRVKQ